MLIRRWIGWVGLGLLLVACAPRLERIGVEVKSDQRAWLDSQALLTQSEVREVLGPPTWRRRVMDERGADQGERWTYVLQVLQSNAFVPEESVDQQTVVVNFDTRELMTTVELGDLSDAVMVQREATITNSYTVDRSFLLRFFSTVGRYSTDR